MYACNVVNVVVVEVEDVKVINYTVVGAIVLTLESKSYAEKAGS